MDSNKELDKETEVENQKFETDDDSDSIVEKEQNEEREQLENLQERGFEY